jgi:hypothetical protein
MIGWLMALPLRLKVWTLGIGAVVMTVLILWANWRVARADAVRAEARAGALQAARRSQLRIITKRSELRERARLAREDLAARVERDAFEKQGWGP